MPLKFINATELRKGSFAITSDEPSMIKNMDVSKTGKHGASNVRIEAEGVIDEKKRIVVMPGSEKVAVPLIEKHKAQVLSINKENKTANIMDLETFETLNINLALDMVDKTEENSNVEYWKIEGKKIIKRLI